VTARYQFILCIIGIIDCFAAYSVPVTSRLSTCYCTHCCIQCKLMLHWLS